MPDELLRTARRLAGGAFDILGELGRSGGERVAYLARESPAGELVALTLDGVETAVRAGTDPSLKVQRALDATIPAAGSRCPACDDDVSTWARHCAACGHDLSGGPPPVSDKNTGRMLAQTAGRGRFDLYGDMARSEGGSPVYFGRDQATDELVALRLEPKDDPEAPVPFTLSVTQRLAALSGGDDSASTSGDGTAGDSGSAGGLRTGARVYVCPACGEQYPPGTFFCPKDGTALRLRTRGKDLVGQTVAGRYRIVERLGQGGMGQVYRAEHIRMGSSCAIKIMNPALEQDPEAMGRFGREATHASRIDHPNVARVYDFGETADGLLFLAMEFVEGETLSAILERDGPLEPSRAAEIGWQIADALHAAHSLGTVHRDIKPDNIIVRRQPDGRELAKIVDFGIARAIEVTEGEQVTRAGFVVGNPKYMSPEQLTGETIDARTDIYSLGCVLYELLVGKPAFAGGSGPAMLTRRLTEPPPSPRASKPAVPAGLDETVTRAMAREPAERFDSAVALRDALEPAIETPITGRRRIQTGGSRRAAAVAGAAGTSVLAMFSGRRLAIPIAGAAVVVAAILVIGQLRRGGATDPDPTGVAGTGVNAAGTTAVDSGDTGEPAPPLTQPATGGADAATANVEPPQAPAGADPAAAGPPPANRNPTQAGAAAVSDSQRTTRAAVRPTQRVPPPPDSERRATPPPDSVRRATRLPVTPPPPAPVFNRLAADSVSSLLVLVDVRAERREYAEAFAGLRDARTRLDALTARFPDEPTLRTLDQRVQDALNTVRTACEAWREIQLQRGLEAPICRQVSGGVGAHLNSDRP
ncbi:MAG: serine/threonine-protein kinase [Gemmatimonadota bacterium]|jgi:serine/threonine-protein kinase